MEGTTTPAAAAFFVLVGGWGEDLLDVRGAVALVVLVALVALALALAALLFLMKPLYFTLYSMDDKPKSVRSVVFLSRLDLRTVTVEGEFGDWVTSFGLVTGVTTSRRFEEGEEDLEEEDFWRR